MGGGASRRRAAAPVQQAPRQVMSQQQQQQMQQQQMRQQQQQQQQHYGHSLAPHSPWTYEKDISAFQLQCMRETFWESVKTAPGRQQAWESIKVACEAMASHDVGLAESVLEASGIMSRDHTLSNCLDPSGRAYAVPRYCWSTPTNCREGVLDGPSNATVSNEPSVELELKCRLCGQGKTVAVIVQSTATVAQLKTALYDTMKAGPSKSSGAGGDAGATAAAADADADADAATAAAAAAEEMLPARQRVFFGGREMRDSYSISSCGVKNGNVVMVMARPSPEQEKAFIAKYT